MNNEPLLTVERLRKYFPMKRGLLRRKTAEVKAVDDVSFNVNTGECFAVVGESGCGKTTLALCISHLISPDEGRIALHTENGEIDVLRADRRQVMDFRARAQMVFQDPYSSLDPRMAVSDIVAEPLRAQGMARTRISERVPVALTQAGLDPRYGGRYPHELSGGERQRVGIARALAIEPSLLFLDEPVSALDVSVRAQVLNLLLKLQQEMDLTYIFITHDLSVVKHLSDRIAVMYLGKLVEVGETQYVFEKAAHPYTEALLVSIPVPDPQRRHERFVISGDVPSAINPPSGCRFSPRCRYAQEICRQEPPALRTVADGRLVACHFAEQLDLAGVQEAFLEMKEPD